MESSNWNVENGTELPIVMKDRKSCIGYYRPSPANRIVSKLHRFFKYGQLNV